MPGYPMKIVRWFSAALLVFAAAPFCLAQFTSTSCSVNSTNRTVTICTPESRTSAAPISSPVQVVAACTDSTAIDVIQIYNNGQKVVQKRSNQIDVTIPLKNGSNEIAVDCKDVSGVSFSSAVHPYIQNGCAPGSGSSLAVCEPTAEEYQHAPVHFIARDFDPYNSVGGMEVVNSSNGSVLFKTCGRLLDAWVKVPAGTYNFTIVALDSCTAPSPDRIESTTVGPVAVN